MSLRIVCAILGAVFGVSWAAIGVGWALFILVMGFVGYYIGSMIEGDFDPTLLLAPLRRPRRP